METSPILTNDHWNKRMPLKGNKDVCHLSVTRRMYAHNFANFFHEKKPHKPNISSFIRASSTTS